MILLGLIGSTVEDVSQREGIGYEAVMGIVRRHIKTKVDWNSINQLQQIGLDEISLKKGHKDFVTIVSAYIEGSVQLLAVLTDRHKETVKAFLESIPKELKKTVKSVCSDMYKGFILNWLNMVIELIVRLNYDPQFLIHLIKCLKITICHNITFLGVNAFDIVSI